MLYIYPDQCFLGGGKRVEAALFFFMSGLGYAIRWVRDLGMGWEVAERASRGGFRKGIEKGEKEGEGGRKGEGEGGREGGGSLFSFFLTIL